MVKRLLGLAILSGLAGIVIAASASGCSSTEIVQQPIADSGSPEVRAAPPINGDASEAQIPTCALPVPTNLDSIPYLPPTVAAGACSNGDITAVENLITSNPNATFGDILKTLQASANKGCADCVFGPDSDATTPTTWPAIVLLTTNDANQTAVPVTGGGCMQLTSGNQNCGKAFDEYYFCLNYVCSACTSQADFNDCGNSATSQTGACAPSIINMQQTCGTNFSAFLDSCFPQTDPADFIGSMRAQCVVGGGADAGIPDAGHD